jgi:hypothetical protein
VKLERWNWHICGGTFGTYTQPVYEMYNGIFDGWATGNDEALVQGIQTLRNRTTAPLAEILAVGDGTCDSTCDTFSRTTWTLSKHFGSELPSFRYATFGGTGKAEDIGGTSFPGGNVNYDDMLTVPWSYNGYVIMASRHARRGGGHHQVSSYSLDHAGLIIIGGHAPAGAAGCHHLDHRSSCDMHHG